MAKLVNRAKMTTATTGTGTITLGSASSGFQTFAAAGVLNGNVVRYVIEDGTAWEIGNGTYTSAGTTMSRTLLSSSTGSLLVLTGSAVVYITATSQDFDELDILARGYAARSDFVTANTASPGLGFSDGQVVFAGGLEYRRLASSTAITGLSGWFPNGTATPQHYGAVADGVTNDRPAFVSANAGGGNLSVDGHFSLATPFTITSAVPQLSPYQTWSDMTDDNDLDWSFGMFRDEGFLPVQRFTGRTFFGEATRHSANRFGANNYGDDYISQQIASWVIKNSQVAGMSPETSGKIGITGAAWIQPSTAGSIGAGVLGISKNEGISGTGRGGYFEVIAAKTAGTASADLAAEFQVGNRTSVAPVVSAYDMGGSIVNGMQVAVEAQMGYTTGNSDTPYAAPTYPAGAAFDVTGGSLNASYQKWTAGLVFRNGALVRDGSSFANAVVLAQKHRFVWEVAASTQGASIWSEVTAGTSRMAQAFRNDEVTFYGPTGQTIAAIRHDTAGAGTVNNPVLRSARTALPVALMGEGSDANVAVDIQSKGAGVIRLMSHGGLGEHLRVIATNAATDFVTVLGSAGLGNVFLGSGGASTNIDFSITPKGTGLVRYGTFTAAVNGPSTGYIEIKDAAGTTRRLGVVTGTPGNGVGETLTLPVQASDPAAPAAGNGTIYAFDIAGRVLPKWIGPSGVDYPLQSHIGFNNIAAWRGGATTTATTFASVVGSMPYTGASPTAPTIPALASTSLRNQTYRSTISTGATAGALAYIRANTLRIWRGNAAGLGGYFVAHRFALSGTLQAGMRVFAGIQDTAANPTNIDPTTNTTPGRIGLAINANSGNWNLVHNITGTAPTVIALGASFPVNNTDLMEISLFCAPNGSSIGYRVVNWSTNQKVSGSLTTNIPAATTFMIPSMWITNNATAAAATLDFVSTYVETDY